MKKIIALVLILTMIFLVTSGCRSRQEKPIRIALQYGLAYAPLIIAKEKQLIEQQLDNKEVEWLQLANSAAIREAMSAGELDIGYMGIPPFLIAYDKGVDWRIFCGLCQSPLALMSNDQTIASLADFGADQYIATPQPGSIQHILLMMAAEKALSDARYFDDQMVALKHPDAMALLLSSDQITAHFASPPYLFTERAAGMKSVLDSHTAFGGDFSFIVGVTYQNGLADDEDLAAIKRAIEEANRFIAQNKAETVAILTHYFEIDEALLTDYLYETEMIYSTDINGMQTFIDFMRRVGYLEGDYSAAEVLR